LRLEKFKDKYKGINFQVETIFPYGVQEGNLVYSDKTPVEDGTYSLGRRSSIYVRKGRIANDKNKILKFWMSRATRILLTLGGLFFLLEEFLHLEIFLKKILN